METRAVICRAGKNEEVSAAVARAATRITGRLPLIVVEWEAGSMRPYRRLTDRETPDFVGSAQALCRAIAEAEDRIAAIVVAPVGGKNLLHRRLVRRVRAIASAEGALLVWHQPARAGASTLTEDLEFYGVTPDLIAMNESSEVSYG